MPITNLRAFLANAEDTGTNNSVVRQLGNTTSTTLRHEEHILYDDALLKIVRQRLNGIEDLRAMGLTKKIGNLGITLSKYERLGDMTAATVSMDGVTKAQKDRVTYDEVGVPIPIFHEEWSLNIRQLMASRNRGEALDTTQTEIAARLVADRMEQVLYLGLPDLIVDGKQIYGYTNHPNRNTFTLSGSGWAVSAGRDIIGDTERMLNALYADNRFGPFVMYVAKDLWSTIQKDYNDVKGEKTYKERIEAFAGISQVKHGDFLPAGNVVVVQLTSDVVDLAVAQDIVNIEWQTNPMQTEYKVYAALAPRVKVDRNLSSGIVHGSPS